MQKQFSVKGIIAIFFNDNPQYYLCNYDTAIEQIEKQYKYVVTKEELSKLYIPLEDCNIYSLIKEY